MPLLAQITQAPIAPDLGNILRLAASTHAPLNDIDKQTGERFDINFASLFVAFLTAEDPVSRWFKAYARIADIDIQAIFDKEEVGKPASVNVSQQATLNVPPSNVQATANKPFPDLYLTQSVSGLLKVAEDLRSSWRLRELSSQLLMGALVYKGSATHANDLRRWRINSEDWTNDYLTFLFAFNPDAFPGWEEYHKGQQTVQLKTLLPAENLKSFSKLLSPTAARMLNEAWRFARDDAHSEIPLTTTCLFYAIQAVAIYDSSSDLNPLFARSFSVEEQRSLDKYREEYFARKVWNSQSGAVSPQPSEAMTLFVGRVLALAQRSSSRSLGANGHSRIEPRHILFALLDRESVVHDPARDDFGAEKLLTAAGIDPDRVRRRVREELAQYPDAQQVGYGTDTVNSAIVNTDLLNIDALVKPLAMLVSAHTTAPPLAIGVFGDWGSGKTFFMERLKRQILSLASSTKASKRPQREVSFYKHIICIDFNAWHYVESNLWASLMEHIFAKLSEQNFYPDAPGVPLHSSDESRKKVLDDQIQHKREQLDKAKQDLDAAQALPRDTGQQVEDEINIVINTVRDQGYAAELKTILERLSLDKTGGSVQELDAALDDLRQVLLRGQTLVELLRKSNFTWRHWVLLVVLVVVVPLMVGLALKAVGAEGIGQIATLFTGLSVLISSAAQWLSKQTTRLNTMLKVVEDAQAKIDETVHGQVNTARKKVDELTQQLNDLISQRRALDPDQILMQFIKERAESNDYRTYLGLLTTIRHDFESLSKKVEDSNLALLGDKTSDEVERIRKVDEQDESASNQQTLINRIVLFIDDLDRCPPEKVVQVLQAVHLLMAFPLFVVVVGVDSRWLSRSLTTHYEDLLSNDRKQIEGKEPTTRSKKTLPAAAVPDELTATFGREATPADYLEKIFQIPIWLPRLQPDGARNIVQAMVNPQAPTVSRPQQPLETPPATNQPTPGALPPPQPTGVRLHIISTDDQPLSLLTEETSGDAPVVLVAPQLEFDRRELEALNRIAPLLHRSPRAVKRFVNLYRLIKAGLSTVELDAFLNSTTADVPHFEIVLFLLALTTNCPELMPVVLNAFKEDRRGKGSPGKATLGKLVATGLAAAPYREREVLRRWIEEAQPDKVAVWNDMPLNELYTRFANVARYSFNTYEE